MNLKTGKIIWKTKEPAEDLTSRRKYYGKEHIYLFSRDKKDHQVYKVRRLDYAHGSISQPLLFIRDAGADIFEIDNFVFISEVNNKKTHILNSSGTTLLELAGVRINNPIGTFGGLIICEERDSFKTSNRPWQPSIIYCIDLRARRIKWSFPSEKEHPQVAVVRGKLLMLDGQKIKFFDINSAQQVAEDDTLRPGIMAGNAIDTLFFYSDTANQDIGKITVMRRS